MEQATKDSTKKTDDTVKVFTSELTVPNTKEAIKTADAMAKVYTSQLTGCLSKEHITKANFTD